MNAGERRSEKKNSFSFFSDLRSPAFIGGAIIFLFFYRLGGRDLWASHEARAAQNAQRILDTGDWGLPRLFDDQVELQKPPLYYWLAAAFGWLRGGTVDAVAARLPAALAGLATVLAVSGFLAGRGRPLAGFVAGAVLATAQHFTWIARTGRIDIPLTFAVTGSVLCLCNGQFTAAGPKARFGWNLAGYLLMACGVLLKGPLGVLLPFVVLTVNAVASRRPVVPPSLAWGLPLVLAVAGPWFVVAHVRTEGAFTRVFFWYHHVQRATGGAEALAAHPWWFYGPRFFFDALPWSLFVPVCGWLMFRRRELWGDAEARLGFLWLVSVLLFLSLSRFKRADYLLPAYPGMALWLGCAAEQIVRPSAARARWLVAGVGSALGAAIVVWAVFLQTVVPRLDGVAERRTLAAAIRAAVPSPEPVLLFRVEDHLLAYHLGRPLNTFLEWENLDVWAGRPGAHHVLMPAECAAVWRQYISSGELAEVLRYTDRSDRRRPRDLVLVRTRPAHDPPSDRTHVRADRPTARRERADQRPAAGLQPGGGPGADR